MQIGTHGASPLQCIPHYSKVLMLALPLYHLTIYGPFKDLVTSVRGGKHAAMALDNGCQAAVRHRMLHPVLTSRHHGTLYNWLDPKATMTMQEGRVLLESCIGYHFHHLWKEPFKAPKALLALMCVPCVARNCRPPCSCSRWCLDACASSIRTEAHHDA